MNIVTNPLTIYGTIAVAIMSCLYLVVSIRMEIAQAEHRQRAQNESLRNTLAAIQQELDDLRKSEHDRAAVPVTSHDLSRSLNVQKRAEAMRMYRRGSDAQTVASTLGLPRAEVALLQKVQRVLADQAAGVVA
jgi:hypothetical protein